VPTIALDVMGGDHAPDEIVKGAALVSTSTDIEMLLVGDEERIQQALDETPYNPENLGILHAAEAIDMTEDPREAMRQKKDASLLVAIRAVADGRVGREQLRVAGAELLPHRLVRTRVNDPRQRRDHGCREHDRGPHSLQVERSHAASFPGLDPRR